MFVSILSGLALALSLTGNILINHKKRTGYVLWIASNVFWVLVNFIDHMNVYQVIMYIVYTVLNVMGFIRWGNDSNKEEEHHIIRKGDTVMLFDLKHETFGQSLEVPEYVIGGTHHTDGIESFKTYTEEEVAKNLGLAILRNGYMKTAWRENVFGRPEFTAKVHVVSYDKE